MPTVAGNPYNQDPVRSAPTSGPRNAQEAIAAQANAKRAAANIGTMRAAPNKPAYGGGPLTQDYNNFTPARGGTMGTGAMSPPSPMGYTPGGFDDPSIDWNAIYEIFIAGPQRQAESAQASSFASDYGGGPGGQIQGPAAAPPPVPSVFQAPATFTAPSIQQPQAVVAEAPSIANAPAGQKFESFGTPSTFGGFERQRNKRGPLNNASVTPEMLRRAASSRLAG